MSIEVSPAKAQRRKEELTDFLCGFAPLRETAFLSPVSQDCRV
jgi:hypothetical protein